jgi:hypothetical protein
MTPSGAAPTYLGLRGWVTVKESQLIPPDRPRASDRVRQSLIVADGQPGRGRLAR